MPLHRLIGARTLVVVLAFALLEGALSLFTGYGKWVATERDPYLGWRPIPAQHGYSWDYTIDERINARGYRDREWGPPPDPDTAPAPYDADTGPFRIALVGNSMTYGSGVAIEDTWGRRLEDLVQQAFERYGVDREVVSMNFAVQGYVFEQMARTYEQEIRPYRPDLLVVGTVPHDVLPFEGGPGEKDFPYRRAIAKTASHDLLLKEVVLPTKAALRLPWNPDLAAAEQAELDQRVKTRPYSEENEPLWDAVRARMAAVQAMVEADGGRLVVVALPQFSNLVRQSPTTHAEVWLPWAESRGSVDGSPRVLAVDPREAFEAAMPELLPAMRERGFKFALVQDEDSGYSVIDPAIPHRAESLYLDFDVGHYDERGHAVLARDVMDALVASGWLAQAGGVGGE